MKHFVSWGVGGMLKAVFADQFLFPNINILCLFINNIFIDPFILIYFFYFTHKIYSC